MNMTPEQHDVLVEIANMGSGKAAKHLSVLLNVEVKMTVPDVFIGCYDEVKALLNVSPEDIITGVHQHTNGFLNADVILLFQSLESRQVVQALIGRAMPMVHEDMHDFEHEAMTEIGNIIISGCVSAIANLLGERIQLNLPVYTEGDLKAMLMQPDIDDCLMVMQTTLSAVEHNLRGILVFAVTRTDLSLLLHQVDNWLIKLQAG